MTTDRTDKKLDQLEKDVKLLKNEILISIMDVHDFLSNLKFLPPHTEGDSGSDEETMMNLRGGMDTPDKRGMSASPPPLHNHEEASTPPVPKMKPVESPVEQRRPPEVKNTAPIGQPPAAPVLPEVHPEKKTPGAVDRTDDLPEYYKREPLPVSGKEPSVNMLANLIGWVSLANSKIGAEQLPILLDVYRTCGDLPSRTRKIIMKLAELVIVQPQEENSPEVWSQLILQLHGVLTGFYCGNTEEKDLFTYSTELVEKEEPKPANNDKSLKLKLILPGDNGHEKELDLGEFITSIKCE